MNTSPGRGTAARKAHQDVDHALNWGRLVRLGWCMLCVTPCRPVAHHEDYTRTLDVVWLCRSCHSQLHGLSGAAKKQRHQPAA